MKKALCVLLVFAVIFCFAACGKNSNKGEIYTPPHTEIITFEDGETAVYEVMTDAKGEPVTDKEGITELIPYDPPVTEDGGYLVTDPEGETIKQSQTTVQHSIEIDQELIDFDTTAPSAAESTTKKVETTTAKTETTASSGGALSTPDKTETTTLLEIPKGETYPLNGTLSKEDAQRLVAILSINNQFDEALSDGEYYEAEMLLSDYLSNIQKAIDQIKADKTLYTYVGNKNLQLWYDYMVEATDRYAIFMGVVRGTEGEKPSKAFYATYGDFQEYYRFSLQVYYHMRTNAEIIIYS